MEEAVPKAASTEVESGSQRQRRRRTKHHGLLHLHRAQKKLLQRAGVFLALLVLIIILWYWMAVRQ